MSFFFLQTKLVLKKPWPLSRGIFIFFQFVVENNLKTLLPQYLGMYRLTLTGAEHYLIVMRNVFSPYFKAHKKYDLKVLYCRISF